LILQFNHWLPGVASSARTTKEYATPKQAEKVPKKKIKCTYYFVISGKKSSSYKSIVINIVQKHC